MRFWAGVAAGAAAAILIGALVGYKVFNIDSW